MNTIPYTREAYSAKKYAFVSDYARFWILYHYGGIYFDTDVQVIKDMTDIIEKGPFMGCEKDAEDAGATASAVAPGLGLGVNPGLGLFKEFLDLYATLHFINPNGSYNQKTIVAYTTETLVQRGLKNVADIQYCAGVWIYPKEYFCPLDYRTNELQITDNTRSVHLYSASWITKSQLMYKRIEKLFGIKFAQFLSKTLKKLRIFK